MSTAAFSAIHHLARLLIERGMLTGADVDLAADRVERDSTNAADEENEDFEWAAHMLRCAIIEAGRPDPEPERPILSVIDGGRDGECP